MINYSTEFFSYPGYWLLAHFIGDYIIQNDWMATNKKKSAFACFVHSVTYIVPFIPLVFLDVLTIWKVLLISSQHYVQDRSNFVVWFFNVTGKKGFGKPPMAPWSITICDNIFHIVFILGVIVY